jgi:hypothetical protein
LKIATARWLDIGIRNLAGMSEFGHKADVAPQLGDVRFRVESRHRFHLITNGRFWRKLPFAGTSAPDLAGR